MVNGLTNSLQHALCWAGTMQSNSSLVIQARSFRVIIQAAHEKIQ